MLNIDLSFAFMAQPKKSRPETGRLVNLVRETP